MKTSAPTATLAIRPTSAQYRRYLSSMGAVGVIIAAGVLASAFARGDGAWALAAAAVAALVAVGWVYLYLGRAGLYVMDAQLMYRSVFRTSRLPLSGIKQVIFVDSLIASGPAVPVARFLIVRKDGKRAKTNLVNNEFYETTELKHFAEELAKQAHAPLKNFGRLTTAELAAQAPGTLASWEAHPVRTALIIVAAVIVFVVAAAAIAASVTE